MMQLILVSISLLGAVSGVELGQSMGAPPVNPTWDAYEQLCWLRDTSILVACPDGLEFKWLKYPPLGIQSTDTDVSSSLRLTVGASFLGSRALKEQYIAPFVVKFCASNLGVCGPDVTEKGAKAFVREIGEFNYDVDLANNAVDITHTYNITGQFGEKHLVALVSVNEYIVGTGVRRTISDVTAPLPKLEKATCSLRSTRTGATVGAVEFSTSGHQVTLDGAELDGEFNLGIDNYGDFAQVFGDNTPWHPETITNNAECGPICTGTLVSGISKASAVTPINVPQVALNGANSVIGRAISMFKPGSRDTPVARCIVEASVQGAVFTTQVQGPPFVKGAICNFDQVGGWFGFELQNVHASASTVRDPYAPGIRVTYAVDGGDALAHTSLRWKLVNLPTSTEFVEMESTARSFLEFDRYGVASSSFHEHTPAISMQSIVGARVVLFNETTPDETVASCVIGSADFGMEEVRPPLPAAIGPVPQAVGASCSLTPLATAQDDDVVTGTIRIKVVGDHLRVSYSIAGVESNAAYRILVHQDGDLAKSHTEGSEDVFTGFDIDGTEESFIVHLRSDNQAKQVTGNDYFRGYYLNGEYGIIGRSLVVVNASNKPVSSCVVGRSHGSETTKRTMDWPKLDAATCRLISMSNVDGQLDAEAIPQSVMGTVQFRQVLDPETAQETTEIDYTVAGLLKGTENTWNIYDFGDIDGTDFFGQVFQGEDVDRSCSDGSTNCVQAKSNWVGDMGGTDALFVAFDGLASGVLHDNAVALQGTNSILGRSVVVSTKVVVDGDVLTVPVASCVVGRAPSKGTPRASTQPPTIPYKPTPVVILQEVPVKSSNVPTVLLGLVVGFGLVFAVAMVAKKRHRSAGAKPLSWTDNPPMPPPRMEEMVVV